MALTAPDAIIFLIGPPGAGKTHWGRLLAGHLKREFTDLDQLVERRAGKSVGELFKESEDAFRAAEAAALRSLKGEKNLVVAAGGGTPCFHQNMEWMKAQGETIYLKVSVPELARRLRRDDYRLRPLLKNVPDAELEPFLAALLAKREPFYLQAHRAIEADELKGPNFLLG